MQYDEIQAPNDLIRAYRLRAKKQFGQHFLSDPSILDNICRYASLEAGQHVLEVGPGCGTLTWTMLQYGANVHAVEIDRDAIAFLSQTLESQAFTLTQGDARRVNWQEVLDTIDGRWTCIANLPYNVGTSIFFDLTKYAHRFTNLTLMFQKEVAKRMVARVGDKAYGSLSLAVQLHYDTRIVMQLPPGAFSPPPKVHSAVVRFIPIEGTRIKDESLRKFFDRLVKTAFQQRRKKLLNTLKPLGLPRESIKEAMIVCDIHDNARPEELNFEQFLQLSEQLIT